MLSEEQALLLVYTKFLENMAVFWCIEVKITRQNHIYDEII
jgi:hypothetical protein